MLRHEFTIPGQLAKIGKGLIFGWRHSNPSTLGFHEKHESRSHHAKLIVDDSDGHTCCVAPTRAGKSRSVIVPNALCFPGTAIFLDPKAEHAYVTSRRRRELTPEVHFIDPTHYFTNDSARLNPIDALLLPGADLEIDSYALAEMLSRGYRGTKEPFWDQHGIALLAALIINAALDADPARRNLKTVLDALSEDDVCYSLATLLDSQGATMNRTAYRTIATVLQMPEVTRGGVLATTQAYVRPLMSESVSAALGPSTISLTDLMAGKPMTIYLILPPHRLPALRGLLKVQLGTIMMALLYRREPPRVPTWLVLDEVGQLENFPILENLLTMSAGYNVRVSMFWQDLAQMVSYYPDSWRTILNNCSTLQTFGIYNRAMATQWGDYMDIHPSEMLQLKPDEQVITSHNQGTYISQRLDYLRDFPMETFDAHPMHPRHCRSLGRTSDRLLSNPG